MSTRDKGLCSLRAALVVLALSGTPLAAHGAPVFSDSFDAGSLAGWQVQNLCLSPGFVQLNSPDAASGGNLDMRPSIESVSVGRAGVERFFAGRMFNQPLSEYLYLQADVRFLSGVTGGELVPMLRQGSAEFLPTGPGVAFSTGVWTRPAGMAFALTDFRNSQGGALAALTITGFGFGVRLAGGPSQGPSAGRYHADNVSLSIVPSPSLAPIALCACTLAARRRRSR